MWKIVKETYRHDLCIDEPPERLGRRSPDNSRPRPLQVRFGTLQGKHLFLKHAKLLWQAGFKVDDDLTPLQQQERKSFGNDFVVLKAKGHNPFFRVSQLHFYADKMQTCRKGKASAIPPADYKQAKDQGSIETVIEAKQPADDRQAKGQGPIEAVINKFNRLESMFERHFKV